jgi:hypothetical protein
VTLGQRRSFRSLVWGEDRHWGGGLRSNGGGGAFPAKYAI